MIWRSLTTQPYLISTIIYHILKVLHIVLVCRDCDYILWSLLLINLWLMTKLCNAIFLETFEPFIATLVTVSLFQNFMSLGKRFLKLNTEFNAYALFVKFGHVKIRRHFARSQTNRSSTMTRQDTTTRLAADNSRSSQLGCATFRKAMRVCIGALF